MQVIQILFHFANEHTADHILPIVRTEIILQEYISQIY